MSICPKCNGSGWDDEHMIKCTNCDNGVVEQTNEEWLRSCPPQELIRFLMNVAYGGQIRSIQQSTFEEEAEKWSKWLKEKHEH